jgi:hypothetical protein
VLLHHEDEVGHRRGVDGPARARPEDHADLGDDAGGEHVAVEDAAVAGQADRALLDAGAGAVVEADERRADLDGEVHHLVDLLGEHLAERSAEHREVLREDEHLAAVDGAPTRHDAVGVGALEQAAVVGPVAGEHVELVERPLVEQELDALAGEHLALGVLPLDGLLGPGVTGLFLALRQLGQSLAHRVLGHRSKRYRRRVEGSQLDPLVKSAAGAIRSAPRGWSARGARGTRCTSS